MPIYIYIMIAIGALWGALTLIGIREDDKHVRELVESARKATKHSHGSE